MKRRLLQLSKERKLHIQKWLDYKKEEAKYIEVANNIIEETDWEIKIITQIPSDVLNKMDITKPEIYQNQNDYIYSTFQLTPLPVNTLGGTASISSASSTDLAFNIIDNEYDLLPWLRDDLNEYISFKGKQNRYIEIHQRLLYINPLLAKELEKSKDAYISAKQGLTTNENAGIMMRNVIEHFKGELFKTLPKDFKANKKWEEMVHVLALGDQGSIEHKTLIDLESNYNKLHIDLTKIAKDLANSYNYSIEDIWVLFIDLLFTTTSLINYSFWQDSEKQRT